MKISNVRNRVLTGAITVLNKARVPAPLDAAFLKAVQLSDNDLQCLVANLNDVINDRTKANQNA